MTIAAELADRIETAAGCIFDMDGTIALGDQASGGHVALPGASELLAELRSSGIPFVVMTNGTAKPPTGYARTLRAAGLDVRDGEMITPSSVAADWLVREGLRRVRVLGNPGTAAPLLEAGLEVIGASDEAQGVQAVYTGWFREFTFPDLEAACNDVWAGATLISASHVPFFATREGRGIGTSFAINVMINALTGADAQVLGKPSIEAFRFALRRMDLDENAADRIVVFGDDPGLEMCMARAAGAIGIGMTTGIKSEEDFLNAPEDRSADLILGDFGPVLELLRRRGHAVDGRGPGRIGRGFWVATEE